MSKRAPKKRRTLPALGLAGVSLSMASGACAAIGEANASTPPQQQTHVFLAEEEISDVSLATFFVFDKENTKPVQLARGGCGGCGGCGHGGGCGCHGGGGGGCAHGGGGCGCAHMGCAHVGGCGCAHVGGCGCGGFRGCGGCRGRFFFGGCAGCGGGGCGGGCGGGGQCWCGSSNEQSISKG